MSAPLFQKRHYGWLAQWLAEQSYAYEDIREWDSLCDAMCGALQRQAKQDGTNFKPDLFLSACSRRPA